MAHTRERYSMDKLKLWPWPCTRARAHTHTHTYTCFWPSADIKPMSNDLVHVMPWHCMFALSTCKLLSLWPPSCPPSLYAPSKRPLLTRPSFTTLFRRPLRALPTDRKTMVRLDKKSDPFPMKLIKLFQFFPRLNCIWKQINWIPGREGD